MARIAYKPLDNIGPEEIVAPIRARRGDKLLNLDRAMLYSPSFAVGWNAIVGSARKDSVLRDKTRELVICVVSTLNHTELELHYHLPAFLKAGGTPAQADALENRAAYASLFDAEDFAVAELAYEMTRDVKVSDKTFDLVRASFPSEREQMELVGLISVYNMVTRFVVALEIDLG